MTEQLQLLLIVGGIAVILGLSNIIYRLVTEERRLSRERAESVARLQSLAAEQHQHLVESVQVISRAMVSDQCGLTEGCIRLKVLLEQLAPRLLNQEDYAIFVTIYNATAHMPILDEWKKLKLRERAAFTEEREALEAKHRDSILEAAKRIAGHDFN